MNYVPLTEVTSYARSIIGTATDLDESLFRYWAWRGLQDLGISDDEIKVCTLNPKGLMAAIPADCRLLLEIALYDDSGHFIPCTFHSGSKRIYPKNTVSRALVNTTPALNEVIIYNSVDVSADRTTIMLGSNGDCVATIVVRYFSYPLDANGLPLIREDEVNAIAYFIRYCWEMRKNDNRSAIAQNKQDWMLESDRVRAKKKMCSPEQFKTIAKTWKSIIPNPNFNRF